MPSRANCSQQQVFSPSIWFSAKRLRPGRLTYWVCYSGCSREARALSSEQWGPASPLSDGAVLRQCLLIYAAYMSLSCTAFLRNGQVNVRQRLRKWASLLSSLSSSDSHLPCGLMENNTNVYSLSFPKSVCFCLLPYLGTYSSLSPAYSWVGLSRRQDALQSKEPAHRFSSFRDTAWDGGASVLSCVCWSLVFFVCF